MLSWRQKCSHGGRNALMAAEMPADTPCLLAALSWNENTPYLVYSHTRMRGRVCEYTRYMRIHQIWRILIPCHDSALVRSVRHLVYSHTREGVYANTPDMVYSSPYHTKYTICAGRPLME